MGIIRWREDGLVRDGPRSLQCEVMGARYNRFLGVGGARVPGGFVEDDIRINEYICIRSRDRRHAT